MDYPLRRSAQPVCRRVVRPRVDWKRRRRICPTLRATQTAPAAAVATSSRHFLPREMRVSRESRGMGKGEEIWRMTETEIPSRYNRGPVIVRLHVEWVSFVMWLQSHICGMNYPRTEPHFFSSPCRGGPTAVSATKKNESRINWWIQNLMNSSSNNECTT